jgi:predicted transcriptional regulator
MNIDAAHKAFAKWLGDEYDLDVLDVVLAVAACEQLDGDPPWLLVVSGPGAAKTEIISPLAGAGAHVTSTISSEGALLSATAKRERSKDATGGLLRKVGDHGLLVIKDVTSIISMAREIRAGVLAALREVYDGKWERNVGTDGGHTLTWTGRLVVIGAVTTAWDSAHAVVSLMGDRFVLVRLDSSQGRKGARRQALSNSGNEISMRTELSAAVASVLAASTDAGAELSAEDKEVLGGLADVVTYTRTAVERDYRGDVIDAHAPEMPTRFAKQLAMVVRGARALGMDRERALALATRCARDSMPPLRLAVLRDVQAHPGSTTHAVRVRLDRPRSTVDQTLQCLHALGLVTVAEAVEGTRSVWRYSLSDLIDIDALNRMTTSTGNVSTCTQSHREEVPNQGASHPSTDVSRSSSDEFVDAEQTLRESGLLG